MATNETAAKGGEALRLTKRDRIAVWLRSTFMQASNNYERLITMGFTFSMVPVVNRLYPNKDDRSAFLKRHLEFFNTHPYLASPILGVTMALEEERAAGADIDDAAIQGVKIGMMGPLAGVGDPVFWGTLRPILGAFAASLALTGNVMGALVFFVVWNVVRMAFTWYTQELGYKQGRNIVSDLSGGIMQKITTGSSILGMFVMGVLIPRWTSINLANVVFSTSDMGAVAEKFRDAGARWVHVVDLSATLEEDEAARAANDAAIRAICSVDGISVDAGGGVRLTTTLNTFAYIRAGQHVQGAFGCINTSRKSVRLELRPLHASGLLRLEAPGELAPGQRASINVAYLNPAAQPHYGTIRDALELLVDGRTNGTVLVTHGIGVDADAGTAEKTAPRCEFSENILKFGSLKRTDAAHRLAFRVSNTGTADLILRAVEGEGHVATTLRPGIRIAPGESFRAEVMLDPRSQDYGVVSEHLVVVTNDPVRPMRRIRVTAIIEE